MSAGDEEVMKGIMDWSKRWKRRRRGGRGWRVIVGVDERISVLWREWKSGRGDFLCVAGSGYEVEGCGRLEEVKKKSCLMSYERGKNSIACVFMCSVAWCCYVLRGGVDGGGCWVGVYGVG